MGKKRTETEFDRSVIERLPHPRSWNSIRVKYTTAAKRSFMGPYAWVRADRKPMREDEIRGELAGGGVLIRRTQHLGYHASRWSTMEALWEALTASGHRHERGLPLLGDDPYFVEGHTFLTLDEAKAWAAPRPIIYKSGGSDATSS